MTNDGWNEPYLETCCRSALHRVYLAGSAGRPAGCLDEACLRRLGGMALCAQRPDGRLVLTEAGLARHASEVLKQAPTAPPTVTTSAR